MARRTTDFQTIRSEGGLLPPDLLRRVLDPGEKLAGTQPGDYGLPPGERLHEVITQSWNRLRKHWAEFHAAAANLPPGEPGTGLTNDRWNLPLLRELGFGLLPTGAGPQLDGRTYAINRLFGPVPIHLIGCGLSLDWRAAGVRGAAAANPHGLVQEFLNRSSGHLWAVVSNGLRFRVLRDNQALSRQSFLEFDLETMFEGEVYSDFVLFWLMAHATRFAPRDGERPESCWLEQWAQEAEAQGTRALGDLRGGVERALQILGEGFTSHPRNTALRDALRSGQVSLNDFHGQLLRVVYRLIFLFVAEDRPLDGQPLLHPRNDSGAPRTARERYAAHYSTARLRELAGKIKGSRHSDLWQQFNLIVGALSGDPGFATAREYLALPALGSFLWDPASTAALNSSVLTAHSPFATPHSPPGAELSNYDFLEALRHLAFTRQGKVLRAVDYRNLGAEELGGVYESLLALTPQISADGARFTFAEFAGSERKTSGSYYTPDSLVQCLLDSALDPVVEAAIEGKTGVEAEQAILALKVCDPAVGSGHFLVGAAHRLARHLARVRALAQGESEPSPLLYQQALRDVIGRCLYGVDVNPMAAELCRVSLWLEALEPGKPLSFLDHHIRVGNSLLGATPELIAAGLPDEAFKPLEGDDKKACSVLRNRNKAAREGQGPLFAELDAETQTRLQQAAAAIEELPDDRPEDIQVKEQAFRRYKETDEYKHKKLLADAWCAAFVIKKYFREPGREASVSGITQGYLNDLATVRPVPADLVAAVERLSDQYQFFHWHLEFPEVYANGGFDCVLGNPPWERIKLEEQQWFSERNPEIAKAPDATTRRRMVEALRTHDPFLYRQFSKALRVAEGEGHLIRNSSLYPLCGRGDINLYTVFAERMRRLLSPAGRVGAVLPTGIAIDHTTKHFFQDLLTTNALVSLFDFSNKKGLFPSVRRHQQFCLITMRHTTPELLLATFAFFLTEVSQLGEKSRVFRLSTSDVALVNPNTHTTPLFKTQKDAELAMAIYRRSPVLIRETTPEMNPWNVRFASMFHMTNDSDLFREGGQLEFSRTNAVRIRSDKNGEVLLPLFDPKMAQQYNHRAADLGLSGHQFRKISKKEITIEQLSDPEFSPEPLYWVSQRSVEGRLEDWRYQWMLGFKDVTGTTSTAIGVFAIIPRIGVSNKFPLVMASADAAGHAILLATLNSLLTEFVLRLKFNGLSLNFFYVKQLPVLPPTKYAEPCSWAESVQPLQDWLLPRILELTYTAWDLEPFALDCGWPGPPFGWNEERRFLLRCELDATFFHLYLPSQPDGQWQRALVAEGAVHDESEEDLARLKQSFPTPRDAVAYIMDTFPIVRRRDEEKHDGDYRTKRVILEIYDAMQAAIRTGQPYRTHLDPPPADPRCCHPPREGSQS